MSVALLRLCLFTAFPLLLAGGLILTSRWASWALWPSAVVTDSVMPQWRMPLVDSTAPLTIAVSTAYRIGFAVGQPRLLTHLGAILGAGFVVAALGRSPLHALSWRQQTG